MWVVRMSNQVKQVIDELEPFNHGITIAIHQSKNECIATFRMPRQLDTKKIEFTGWNEDVTNRTSYHSESDLLNAYVHKARKVTNDWICVEVLPF